MGRATGRPSTSRPVASRTAPPSMTQTSQLVPPMSKHSDAPLAGVPGGPGRARGAARGPGQDGRGGVVGGVGDRRQAAGGLHHVGRRQARLLRALDEPPQVVRQQRREGRVELGGGGALELAEGADRLVRERHVDAGERPGEGVAQGPLVLGVAVAVQQADRDRLRLQRAQRVQHLGDPVAGQRLERPVGGHALGSADAPLGRDQRGRAGGAEAVEVPAGLAAQLDEVLEAGRGDERGARAPALQERVGGDRRAVGEGLDARGRRSSPLERSADGVQDALGLVVRGGRRLGRDEPPAHRQHGVREGASDVDAQQHGAGRYRRGPPGAARAAAQAASTASRCSCSCRC